jgi:exonuclease 3'-5' domain-containing protein 1
MDGTERLIIGRWGEIGNFDSVNRTFIDTQEKLRAFLPILLKLRPSTREAPELTLDSEGWNLGIHGTLTILQMRIRSLKHTFVFDVLALGGTNMFETEGAEGQSLKKVLQSKEHVQLWWDLRQDQEALLHHLGILIGNRIDVQLMELAVRNSPYVQSLRGLSSAVWIDGHTWMSNVDVFEWVRKNKEAKEYFAMSNYECFNQRPLSDLTLEYSADDVDAIERLYDVYCQMMTDERWELVLVETDNRILRSMLPDPPKGNFRAPESFALLPMTQSTTIIEEDTAEGETAISDAEVSEGTTAGSQSGFPEEGVPEEGVLEWEQDILATIGQAWGASRNDSAATSGQAWGEATDFVGGESDEVEEY